MSENKKETSIEFKDFLDKSTNLITIFGVFNALFIYSSTLTNFNSGAASFLLPTFFLLSLLIWLELILYTMKSNNGSWKYLMFYFLAASIEIGLIWFFVDMFAILLFTLSYYGIFMLAIFSLSLLLIKILRNPISKLKKNAQENISYLIIIIAIIIIGVFIRISLPYLKPFTEKVYKKLSDKDSINLVDSLKR